MLEILSPAIKVLICGSTSTRHATLCLIATLNLWDNSSINMSGGYLRAHSLREYGLWIDS